jgi:hypothetical protein
MRIHLALAHPPVKNAGVNHSRINMLVIQQPGEQTEGLALPDAPCLL